MKISSVHNFVYYINKTYPKHYYLITMKEKNKKPYLFRPLQDNFKILKEF